MQFERQLQLDVAPLGLVAHRHHTLTTQPVQVRPRAWIPGHEIGLGLRAHSAALHPLEHVTRRGWRQRIARHVRRRARHHGQDHAGYRGQPTTRPDPHDDRGTREPEQPQLRRDVERAGFHRRTDPSAGARTRVTVQHALPRRSESSSRPPTRPASRPGDIPSPDDTTALTRRECHVASRHELPGQPGTRWCDEHRSPLRRRTLRGERRSLSHGPYGLWVWESSAAEDLECPFHRFFAAPDFQSVGLKG